MRSIFFIALNTWREAVRSKVLYAMFLFALILILAAAFFGTVSIGSQVIVVQNFGLFAISIFTVAYACISGSSFLHKELQRRTISTVLSRPVSRSAFIMGKYFGMLLTITVMIVTMGGALFGFVFLLEGSANMLLLLAFLNIWLELAIVAAAAVFFSSIVVTPVLSGILTFGVFLAGRSASYVLYFVRRGEIKGTFARALEILYWFMPHLDFYDTNNSIVYGIAPAPQQIYASGMYALGYAGVLLCLASLFFMRREFK